MVRLPNRTGSAGMAGSAVKPRQLAIFTSAEGVLCFHSRTGLFFLAAHQCVWPCGARGGSTTPQGVVVHSTLPEKCRHCRIGRIFFFAFFFFFSALIIYEIMHGHLPGRFCHICELYCWWDHRPREPGWYRRARHEFDETTCVRGLGGRGISNS